jgi:hypothetical protein
MRSKTLTLLVALLLSLAAVGCDNLTGVTDLNDNPTQATSMEPALQFANLPLDIVPNRYEAWRGNLIHAECIAQHVASTFTAWSGCRYTRNSAYMSAHWDRQWTVIRNIEDVLVKTNPEENPDLVNLNAMTRILRVFFMQRMTDLYGNIPYEQAGKGLTEDVQNPEYDAVEEIYPAMISDLQEARGLLDAGAPTLDATEDLLFAGDIARWQRFANSLILRIGMRMSEVAPGQAQSAVEDAINGGVMESNDDIAYTIHAESNGDRYGVGEVFNDFPNGGHGFHMSQTFMDVLKGDAGVSNVVDPRTSIFAAQYTDTDELVSDNPADLQGLQNGLQEDEFPDDRFDFAQPNRAYMVRYDSPSLWMTFAEVKFLLAEAALRGWGTSGAQQHYEEGIEAAMKHLTLYGAPEIADADIQTYLGSLPDRDPTLEEVIEQKWIALFLNGYESWAELRRTGFPDEIEPVNYPGNITGGQIPSRLEYPNSEQFVNGTNYEAGATQPNQMSTQLWWAVEGTASI